jgi:hypothetical protein
MHAFQLFGLILSAWLFARSLTKLLRRQKLMSRHASLAAVWLAAAAAFYRPELTSLVARMVGVGRGADLVSYAVAIGFLLLSAFLLDKLGRLEAQITIIVRELALRSADGRESGSAEDDVECGPAAPGQNREANS